MGLFENLPFCLGIFFLYFESCSAHIYSPLGRSYINIHEIIFELVAVLSGLIGLQLLIDIPNIDLPDDIKDIPFFFPGT